MPADRIMHCRARPFSKASRERRQFDPTLFDLCRNPALAEAAAVVLVGTKRMKSLIWWSLIWRPVKRRSLICVKNQILDRPPETAKHQSIAMEWYRRR